MGISGFVIQVSVECTVSKIYCDILGVELFPGEVSLIDSTLVLR